jgi:aryl-alcohol dehydrogenase-like predicted oxidoreductase
MRYRPLGGTGLTVSELAMGGLFVASFATQKDEARRAVRRAMELGINYVDTAPGYHDSEEVLGSYLACHLARRIVKALAGRDNPFPPVSTRLWP